MTIYYVKVRTVESGHSISESYYGCDSGPFSDRRTAEQAAANALKQQGVMSAMIRSEEVSE